jgi:hypothetical protein
VPRAGIATIVPSGCTLFCKAITNILVEIKKGTPLAPLSDIYCGMGLPFADKCTVGDTDRAAIDRQKASFLQ